MTKVVVRNFSVSIDGYGAGPSQDLTHPLGVGGPELFDWFFHTRTFNQMQGNAAGETGVDDDLSAQSMIGMGAWIMGRNMFGPIRGPWADDSWKGWWGDEPPYHAPVHAALEQAKAVARGKDIRIGGGVATIRQYLRARLIDELHLALSPVLLGKGENLLEGLDMRALGYECVKHAAGTRAAAHVFLRQRA